VQQTESRFSLRAALITKACEDFFMISPSLPQTVVPVGRLLLKNQLSLSFSLPSQTSSIAITPQISNLLASGCVVAIGVSGGKDSQACAIRTSRYLDEIGHTGPRILVHAHLGVVEWTDSLSVCELMAQHLGLELVVVRRKAGGMLARWQSRWKSNVERYRQLSCVRLILPWSTPSLRYCTSELKVGPITSALKKRFPQHAIVSVSGIRRQESAKRRGMAVSAVEPKLQRRNCDGATWNPIIEWTLDQVLEEVRQSGLALHEAYTRYGLTRVSCVFCIMSSAHDLAASATCDENRDVYRAMVQLEAESSFAFQGTRWLADVAPHLLEEDLLERVRQAKKTAELRRKIEAEIPNHLLYTKGWPTSVPKQSEADVIADVRRRVSELLDLNAAYLTADTVRARYAALLEEKHIKDASRQHKKSRSKYRAGDSRR
jgi:3'-phosphoadenosine 5'-phosphosulfate sulfotransferase (PAPS reductase)/FAD synthetase